MIKNSLLSYKKNIYSQNGEDGIIHRIFEIIGTENKTCCEVGAGDGVRFSNTRQLILGGWRAVMVERNARLFRRLKERYKGNSNVFCVNHFIDETDNTLDKILQGLGVAELDFLSLDIDGLDYEILKTLRMRPRLICVEVNAGHMPTDLHELPREIAKRNIGQPFAIFSRIASENGYGLVCYTGNAFFLEKSILAEQVFAELSPEEAYLEFLVNLARRDREWLYLVNLGLVPPYYRYGNSFLRGKALHIPFLRVFSLFVRYFGDITMKRIMRWLGDHSSQKSPHQASNL